MTEKVGLNLDIEPRHWEAGNAASRKHRQRLEREKKIAPGDVIIRPEHRLAGAIAANRAKARDRDEEATLTPDEPSEPVLSPFRRSGAAIADLCAVFGYPPAVIPKLRPSRVHHIKVPADNLPPDPLSARPQNQAGNRKLLKPDLYRTRGGKQEKHCGSCGQWLLLDNAHWRWHKPSPKRPTGSFSYECRVCDNLRRREAVARREAGP